MSTFQFKHFSVTNEKSAMKVNTDGVLLGAAMTILSSDRRFLDIGTGTGTIALMAAQRISSLSAELDNSGNPDFDNEKCIDIQAVEIDVASAEEAERNFSNSPWSEVLHVYNKPFDEFAALASGKYDVIFSNPPYFDLSLLAPSFRRCNARHTSSGLSFREILDFAATSLSDGGRVALVLPADQERHLCRHARMSGLFLSKILRIRTVPRKQPSRIVAEFVRQRPESAQECLLTIQDEGKYTQEYLSLTRDFYLFA